MSLLTPRIILGGALALGLLFPRLVAADTSGPRYYAMPSTGGAPLPFSEAVQLGETLYVSGQVGNAPGTFALVPGGIDAEARQVMENLKAILERHGSSLDRVMKCTVFLADIKDWPAFNAVYRTYFKTNLPARSALAASGLALGAKVEVECIAWAPPAKP
jgi:2-iminobutanoate/2-iminopropanoate deaminase